jgi:hypothetical protein
VVEEAHLLGQVLLDGAGVLEPGGVAVGRAEVLELVLEDDRAGVLGPVDAVAPAGDPGVLLDLLFDPLAWFEVALVEFLEGLHYLLVGAAVERPREGPDAAGDRGVDVRERGGDHHGGEGGGVEAVVGVEDQRHVEGLGGDVVGLLARQHVEEVGGVAEVPARLERVVAAAEAVVVGQQGGNLRHHAPALPPGGLGVPGVGVGFPLAGRQHRHARPEGRHGPLAGLAERRQRVEDGVVDGALGGHVVGEGLEGRGVGEVAVPEQVGDLLVAGLPGEVGDVVAPIDELPGLAVDVAEGRLRDEHALQALLEFVCHTPE